MTTNMNILGDSNLDLVDPTMYKNLIGSLMYLVNTRLDNYYAMSAFS